MGIKVYLDEDLEREFREFAMKRFGYSKGSIKNYRKCYSPVDCHGISDKAKFYGKKETKKVRSGFSDRPVEECQAQRLSGRAA